MKARAGVSVQAHAAVGRSPGRTLSIEGRIRKKDSPSALLSSAMIDSQGGVTGGATIGDFLRSFAREGYTSHFIVRQDGALECGNCHERLDPDGVTVRSMRRVEGASDPADMSIVSAMECPRCGARGTATLLYGVHAPPEHAEVLRHLHQERRLQDVESDHSLVLDTGWLDGPKRF